MIPGPSASAIHWHARSARHECARRSPQRSRAALFLSILVPHRPSSSKTISGVRGVPFFQNPVERAAPAALRCVRSSAFTRSSAAAPSRNPVERAAPGRAPPLGVPRSRGPGAPAPSRNPVERAAPGRAPPLGVPRSRGPGAPAPSRNPVERAAPGRAPLCSEFRVHAVFSGRPKPEPRRASRPRPRPAARSSAFTRSAGGRLKPEPRAIKGIGHRPAHAPSTPDRPAGTCLVAPSDAATGEGTTVALSMDFRGSIPWLDDSLSTLQRDALAPARCKTRFAPARLRSGGRSFAPAGFAMKGFSYVSVHMAFSFRELTWRNPLFLPLCISGGGARIRRSPRNAVQRRMEDGSASCEGLASCSFRGRGGSIDEARIA